MRWIIWYAVVLHVVWGAMLLLDSRASYTTGIHALTDMFGSPVVAGVFLLVVGVLAAYGLFRSRTSMIGYLPQQFALLVSAGGAMRAMTMQQFADGVTRPFAFIFCDQLPAVLAAVLHSVALVVLRRGR